MRRLNLLEYQSKGLLQESGVAIQTFRVLEGKQDEADLNDFSKYLATRPEIQLRAKLNLNRSHRCSRVRCQSTNSGRWPWQGPFLQRIQRRRSHYKRVNENPPLKHLFID